MTTKERIEKIEKELIKLKELENLEAFKNHLDTTYKSFFEWGKPDPEKFNILPIEISFRNEKVELTNSFIIYDLLNDLIDTKIEELGGKKE